LKVKSSDDAILLLNYTNDHNTFYFVTAPCNTLTSQVTYPTGSNPYSVVAADVNGDGKPDIVVANSYSNDTGVLLNTGNGTFAAQVTYPTGTSLNSENTSYSAMLNIAESIPPMESIPPIPELHPTQFHAIPESLL
jgi:hypothetical protein